MSQEPGITPEDKQQVADLKQSAARWVGDLQMAGYEDKRIAGALITAFRDLSVKNVGGCGYINALAAAIEQATYDLSDALRGLGLGDKVGEDAISRLMTAEGISFIEAVERIARERGE